MVFSDIIDIDISSPFNYTIKNEVERIMEVVPKSESVLVSGVDDHLFDSGSFLVVKESKIVGVLASHSEDIVRMGEAISNGNTFKTGKESLVVLGFSDNLFSNSWGIFSTIAFSENDKMMVSLDT